jgi:hypothetical protein
MYNITVAVLSCHSFTSLCLAIASPMFISSELSLAITPSAKHNEGLERMAVINHRNLQNGSNRIEEFVCIAA